MIISANRLTHVDAHFRAANYLSAAQLYLADNPLLHEPLRPEHIKPRLLGHWGTAPGLNLIYAHLNRLIQDTDVSLMQIVGVGHGAPAVLAGLYLEGSLGEIYPQYLHGIDGLTRFVHDFSWPGGLPSHLTAFTPGTIHEGGELGYSLLHAFGAVFDNPDLVVACVIGDGEAETGALAASWHSPKFLNPQTDGAVLPILHLNGYKLSGPTLLARMPEAELMTLLRAHGYEVRFVAGDDPIAVHREMWAALDWAYATIRAVQREARDAMRSASATQEIRWPLIVLRTPKGWTGPKAVDGVAIEGTFRAHQIPISSPKTNPSHLAALEQWLTSYRPAELFDRDGRPTAAVTAMCPERDRCLGRNPHANGGQLLVPLVLPDVAAHAVPVDAPGRATAANTEVLGRYFRDVFRANAHANNFRLFCPDETNSNKLGAVFEATTRVSEQRTVATDEAISRDGRVMEILSEHCCEGWLEGYLQTGRHGVFACYEAFISIVDSMMFQYAKWQKMASEAPWRKPVASLNYLLTSHVWEQDHNGYSHQGPTFINALLTKKTAQTRVYLPPDANCLLATMAHCLRSRDRINLVVASKKPMPQWLSMDAARAHCAAGASVWDWAGDADSPDVVLVGAGDVPTREIVAAAGLLARHAPSLRLRVVNVIDLMALGSGGDYTNALDEARFSALFTDDVPVVMAFHGYPMLIHELIYRRPMPARFHVHGYREEGTTTTPFDMAVLNHMSRYQLAIDALRRAAASRFDITPVVRMLEASLERHRYHVRTHGEDLPEIRDWSFESQVNVATNIA